MAIAIGRRTAERPSPTVGVDVARFETFHARERERLVGALAFALGDVDLAADAVDEALARAYQRWSTVGRYDDPAGWVYRVATNWARSVWRRSRRVIADSAPDVVAPGGEPVLVDPALWAAVAALPDAQRDTVVLRFVLDWPHDRIAAALGTTPGTTRSRLARGLETLRGTLGEGPR